MSTLINIFQDIANGIRSKLNTINTYTPIEMPIAINMIHPGVDVDEYIVTPLPGDDGVLGVKDYNKTKVIEYCTIMDADEWDITDASNLFANNISTFNQYKEMVIGNNVTNTSNMFSNCRNFNIPVKLGPNLIDARFMFRNCINFNQYVHMSDNTNIKVNGAYMFQYCSKFNQPVDLNCFNNCYDMFFYCHRFNQPVILPSLKTDMNFIYMFSSCYNFNQPVTMPNTAINTDMSNMFMGCNNFNQNISILKDCNVNTMSNGLSRITISNLLGNCTNFNSHFSFINNVIVKDMNDNFAGISIYGSIGYRLKGVYLDYPIQNLYSNNLYVTLMIYYSNVYINGVIRDIHTISNISSGVACYNSNIYKSDILYNLISSTCTNASFITNFTNCNFNSNINIYHDSFNYIGTSLSVQFSNCIINNGIDIIYNNIGLNGYITPQYYTQKNYGKGMFLNKSENIYYNMPINLRFTNIRKLSPASGDSTILMDDIFRLYNSSAYGFNNFNCPVNIEIKDSVLRRIQMQNMFAGDVNFNAPVNINIYNTYLISDYDAEVYFVSMFNGCKSFNQPLDFTSIDFNNIFKIKSMNTINVDFTSMFNGCENFNSRVTFPEFGGAQSGPGSSPSHTIILSNMFSNSGFNQPIEFKYDYTTIEQGSSRVRGYHLYHTFSNCNNFNSPIFISINGTDRTYPGGSSGIESFLSNSLNWGSKIYINIGYSSTNKYNFPIYCINMLGNTNNSKIKEIYITDDKFIISKIISGITWTNYTNGKEGCYNSAYNIYVYNNWHDYDRVHNEVFGY